MERCAEWLGLARGLFLIITYSGEKKTQHVYSSVPKSGTFFAILSFGIKHIGRTILKEFSLDDLIKLFSSLKSFL